MQRWIDEVPYGRALLAIFMKVPALAVLGIVCALAHNRWDGPFTRGVFYTLMIAGAAVLALWLKARADIIEACASSVSHNAGSSLKCIRTRVGRAIMRKKNITCPAEAPAVVSSAGMV